MSYYSAGQSLLLTAWMYQIPGLVVGGLLAWWLL
jgi:hypothetical protein